MMGCHLGIPFCPLGRAKCRQEREEERAEEREQRSGFGTLSESSWARSSLEGSSTPANKAEQTTHSTLRNLEFKTPALCCYVSLAFYMQLHDKKA